MGRRIIDLSFEVYQGMMVYPSVAKPVIVEMENHEEMARSMGTDKLGITHLPNHCMIVTGDHVGTHLDSWGHVNPKAPRVEGIPLEYCYGDGVVLDFTAKGPGDEIWPDDVEAALKQIDYTIKPLLTHDVKIEEFTKGLDLLRGRQAIKVTFDMGNPA